MLLTFLQTAGLMDWMIIDLIFISVFAVSITINLFLLGRRLHRIEQRKIFDLEGCRYHLQLLDEFRYLHTNKPKQGPFDDNNFQFFTDLPDEKNDNFDSIHKHQKSSTTPEVNLQAPVELFQLGSAEVSVKGKHESVATEGPPEYTVTKPGEANPDSVDDSTDSSGPRCPSFAQPQIMPLTIQEHIEDLHDIQRHFGFCCGCYKTAKPVGAAHCGWYSKRSAEYCAACLESVKKQVTLWGDSARAYCTCGQYMAGNVTETSATDREVHIEYIRKNIAFRVQEEAVYIVVDMGGDTIGPLIIHVDFATGQGRLCEGSPSSGSSAEQAQKGDNAAQHTCTTNPECECQRIEKLGRGLAYTCCGCRTQIGSMEPLELCPARICDNTWCMPCWDTMGQIAEYSSTRFSVYCPCGTKLDIEGSKFLEDRKHLALDAAVFETLSKTDDKAICAAIPSSAGGHDLVVYRLDFSPLQARLFPELKSGRTLESLKWRLRV